MPSIQHSLLLILQLVEQGELTLEKMVEKMAHNPAKLFGIKDRGYIKEGYFADFVLINPNKKTIVTKDSLQSKCKWSPFKGKTFDNKIVATYLNGEKVFENDTVFDRRNAMMIEKVEKS